jgi:hypothetical protein
MDQGDERFDWGALVPLMLHPSKVAVIEALAYVGEPLSPADLHELVSVGEWAVKPRSVDWHVKALKDAGVLDVIRQETVRNSVRSYFFFSDSIREG